MAMVSKKYHRKRNATKKRKNGRKTRRNYKKGGVSWLRRLIHFNKKPNKIHLTDLSTPSPYNYLKNIGEDRKNRGPNLSDLEKSLTPIISTPYKYLKNVGEERNKLQPWPELEKKLTPKETSKPILTTRKTSKKQKTTLPIELNFNSIGI